MTYKRKVFSLINKLGASAYYALVAAGTEEGLIARAIRLKQCWIPALWCLTGSDRWKQNGVNIEGRGCPLVFAPFLFPDSVSLKQPLGPLSQLIPRPREFAARPAKVSGPQRTACQRLPTILLRRLSDRYSRI